MQSYIKMRNITANLLVVSLYGNCVDYIIYLSFYLHLIKYKVNWSNH